MISSVINQNFLQRLEGLRKRSSSDSSSLQGQGASESAIVSLSSTLRFGARTFANSVQRINGVISGVNLAESSIGRLSDLVDSMIELSTDAVSSSESPSRLRRLDRDFQSLKRDFSEILEEFESTDFDLLTEEGLSRALQSAGLDRDLSESVAEVMEEFFVIDGKLASGEVEDGTVSRSLLTRGGSSSAPRRTVVNKGQGFGERFEATDLGITFQAADDTQFSGENPAFQSIITSRRDGSVSTLQVSLSEDVTYLGSSQSGLSVFSTSEDLLGTASPEDDESFEKLYLADQFGNVTRSFGSKAAADQLTSSLDVTVEGREIVSADVSNDGSVVVAQEKLLLRSNIDASTESAYVITTYRSNDQSGGEAATAVTFSSDQEPFTQPVEVNGSGTHALTGSASQGTLLIRLRDGEIDPFLRDNALDAKFVTEDSVAAQRLDSNGYSLLQYTFGEGRFLQENTIVEGGASRFVYDTAEGETFGSVAFVTQDGRGKIKVVHDTDIVLQEHDAGSSGDIANLSLSRSSGGKGRFNVAADITDTERELVQFSGEKRRSSRVIRFDSLFEDDGVNLRTPGAAFGVLAKLEGMKEQLQKNSKAFGELRELIGNNLDLVRASGFAFLTVADSINSTDDAESVTQKLVREIQGDPSAARAQAENLELLVVAALTGDGIL